MEHGKSRELLLRSPIEVVDRLDRLGLTRDGLVEVAEAMHAARNSCTENDPPGAPGLKAWCDGTRRLREVFVPLGWERSEEDHLSSITNPSSGVKVLVCNTDDGTGIERSQPQNRSKKGSATDRAISINQGTFIEILDEALNVVQMPATNGGVKYWYLCVYSEGEILRAELACPSECESGFFKGFHERIFLNIDDSGDDLVRVVDQAPDGGEDFEVTVTRKRV